MGRLENGTLILILAEKICKAHAATLLFLFFLSPKPLHPSPFHQEKTPRYSSPPLPSPDSEREKSPIGNAAPADPHSAVGVQISPGHAADAAQPFLLTTSVPRHRRRRRATPRTYALRPL